MSKSASDLPKPHLVFLGSDLNPISVKCLAGLAVTGKYEILVGLDGGRGGSAISLLLQAWKRHGVSGVLRRVRAKHHASTRLKHRREPSDGGYLSLREVMTVHQLEGFEATPINAPESRARIQAFDPDLIVVANFSQIMRSSLLSLPRLGVINFHPSLLPKYRGPMPFYWILKNGEKCSGVTVHFIDEGVDSGDIIVQAEIEVQANDSEESLRQRSIDVGVPLLVEAVTSLLNGSAQRRPQDEAEASYFGFPPRGASRL